MSKTDIVGVAGLSEYGLSLLIINYLEEKLGIVWIEDLLIEDPDSFPDRIPGFGPKLLAKLKAAVANAGLEFAPMPKNTTQNNLK